MSKDSGITITGIRCSHTNAEVRALPAEVQAEVAYRLFGAVADQLTELGFAPDLIAQAASDMGWRLMSLDGSPPRVVRVPPSLVGHRE